MYIFFRWNTWDIVIFCGRWDLLLLILILIYLYFNLYRGGNNGNYLRFFLTNKKGVKWICNANLCMYRYTAETFVWMPKEANSSMNKKKINLQHKDDKIVSASMDWTIQDKVLLIPCISRFVNYSSVGLYQIARIKICEG